MSKEQPQTLYLGLRFCGTDEEYDNRYEINFNNTDLWKLEIQEPYPDSGSLVYLNNYTISWDEGFALYKNFKYIDSLSFCIDSFLFVFNNIEVMDDNDVRYNRYLYRFYYG